MYRQPMAPEDDFARAINEHAGELPRTLRRIADYFEHHRLEVISSSALELASRLGTSDASIVRTAKALGFDGLPDLKRALARSMNNGPVVGFRETLASASADARTAAQRTLDGYREQLDRLADTGAETLQAAAALLAACQRVAIFGIGPTSHVAAYGAALLRR